MHIVIIPAFFQTKNRPTLGSFFLDQAKALKKAGHEVTILYADTYSIKCIKECFFYEEQEQESIQGISIYRSKCFCPKKHGMEGYKEAFAREIIKLWDKYLKNKKTDIIHAHCAVWAGYAAMQLSEKTRIPYVVTEHATLFQLHREEISSKNSEVIRQVFQKAVKVICVSRAFAKLLSDYRKDIEIIGNVVDFDLFQLTKEKKAPHPLTFLTVCYMEEEAQLKKKGLDILLQAWSKVQKNIPQARLLIGGGGKAQVLVKQWVEAYQISDSVTFLGALKREQVAEYMQKCDCFVLPSRYETFGVVYVEAFACGKPVIAVANGGPDDFVDESNGILIAANEEALSKALQVFVQKRVDYQPEYIREQAMRKFSMKAIASALERLYTDCI